MSDPGDLDRSHRDATSPSPIAVSQVTVRFVAGLLAVAVAVAHVADQGGVTALAATHWLGWACRLTEVGAVATALGLVRPRSVLVASWVGLVVGTGPFLGYVAFRAIGVPGDPAVAGNWSDWIADAALLVEAELATVSVALLRMSLNDRQPAAESLEAERREGNPLWPERWSLWLPTGFK